MADQVDAYTYLEQLYEAWETAPDEYKDQLSAEIDRVQEAVDPGGKRRQQLAADAQRHREAADASLLDKIKTGAVAGLDAMDTSARQAAQYVDMYNPFLRAGGIGKDVTGAALQQTTGAYNERVAEREAMMRSPVSQASSIGVQAAPWVLGAGRMGGIGGTLAQTAPRNAALGAADLAMTQPVTDPAVTQGLTYPAQKAGQAAIGAALGAGGDAIVRGITQAPAAARGVANAVPGVPALSTQIPSQPMGPQQYQRALGPGEEVGQYMLGGPEAVAAGARPGMHLADEFGVPITPARRTYIESGEAGPLQVERAARRRADTDIGRRVRADLQSTQEGVESAWGRIPGGGGFNPTDAEQFKTRILAEAGKRRQAEKDAWSAVDRLRDDPVLDPADALTMYQDLRRVIQDDQVAAHLAGVKPMLRYLAEQEQMQAGLTAGGLSNFRKGIVDLGRSVPNDDLASQRLVGLVKQRLDEQMLELSEANHNNSAAAIKRIKDAVRASAEKNRYTRGKERGEWSKRMLPTQLANTIADFDKGADSRKVVSALLDGTGSKARRLLREIERELGPEAAAQTRNEMRAAFMAKMTKAKIMDGGNLYHKEGYKAISDNAEKFIRENQETFEALFEPAEQAKIKRFLALHRDLTTPQELDNWSGTSGALTMLQRLNATPIIGDALGAIGESNLERVMEKTLYP